MSNHDQFDLEAMREAINYKSDIAKRICIALNGSSNILDLGAGRGDFASLVHASTGTRPTCVEIDQHSIPYLKSLMFDVHQTAETLPAIDGIYSVNVLEHVLEPSKLLAQYAQKLDLGGKVFIYVPALPSLYGLWDVRVGHYHRFTKDSLTSVVQSSGLQVINSGYTDPFGAVITLAMKWLKKGSKPLSPTMVHIYDRFVYPFSALMETVFRRVYGKNVWVVAVKLSSHNSDTKKS